MTDRLHCRYKVSRCKVQGVVRAAALFYSRALMRPQARARRDGRPQRGAMAATAPRGEAVWALQTSEMESVRPVEYGAYLGSHVGRGGMITFSRRLAAHRRGTVERESIAGPRRALAWTDAQRAWALPKQAEADYKWLRRQIADSAKLSR